MFTVQYREEVLEKIIDKAKQDTRIVSAAVVGSYALGNEDRWSDIDLTFAVREEFTVAEILHSWTEYVLQEFSGVVLFDAVRGNTVYRVYMLPGCLQVDLSFSPEKEFGAVGKNFKLLYGKQFEKPQPKPQANAEIFGLLIHHLVRARFCSERNRLWQAEFWISEARNYALKLACIAHHINPDYARGFDDLPQSVLSLFKETYVKELSKSEILRALQLIITALPNISDEVNEMTIKVKETLSSLCEEV